MTVATRTTTLAIVVATIVLTACSQTGFSIPDRRTGGNSPKAAIEAFDVASVDSLRFIYR